MRHSHFIDPRPIFYDLVKIRGMAEAILKKLEASSDVEARVVAQICTARDAMLIAYRIIDESGEPRTGAGSLD